MSILLALSFGSLIAASAIAFAINVYFGIAVAYTKVNMAHLGPF